VSIPILLGIFGGFQALADSLQFRQCFIVVEFDTPTARHVGKGDAVCGAVLSRPLLDGVGFQSQSLGDNLNSASLEFSSGQTMHGFFPNLHELFAGNSDSFFFGHSKSPSN